MRTTVFNSIIAAIGGVAAFLFGELNGVLYALIALMVLDYLTGVIGAAIRKECSSAIGFKGILKKFVMLVIVAVGNLVCVYVFGDTGVVRTAVICFFIANEGLSILENAGSMGVPLPKKLIGMLEQLKNKPGEGFDDD